MPTRITVRYLGSEVGKKVARPDTKGELLELAAKRLNLSTPALRVFAEGGDEYDGDEDVVLIEGTCEPRTRTSIILRTGHSTRTVALVGYQVATPVPHTAVNAAGCRRLSSTPSPSRLLVAAPGPALCRCTASAAYTLILYRVCYINPPNEHTSEGGRDDRGVPYHAESTLSHQCNSAGGMPRSQCLFGYVARTSLRVAVSRPRRPSVGKADDLWCLTGRS